MKSHFAVKRKEKKIFLNPIEKSSSIQEEEKPQNIHILNKNEVFSEVHFNIA